MQTTQMIKSCKIKLYNWSEFYGKKIGLDLFYFVKNGFWMVMHQAVDIITGILLFAIFARLSTKEALGYFQFVMSVFAVVSVISIPGLNTSILRDVSRGYDGEYVPAVRKSFIYSLFGVPIIIAVGFYYYLFDNHGLGLIIMITSIFFPIFYAPNTWSAFLQGKGKYKKFATFGIIQSVMNSIVTVAMIYFSDSNALLIVSVYLLSFSILNIFYYYKSLSYVQNNKKSGNAISYGWFLTKINFFYFIGESVDKIIIGTLLSPVLLAIFSVVSALPFKIRMVIKSIFAVLFPKMSQDNFLAINFFKKKQGFLVLVLIFFISLISGSVYYFSIVPISALFFGSQYADYFYYGKYFVILVVISIPLLLTSLYLQAKKMTKSIAYINLVSFFIKIISLIVGVKLWGIMGGIWLYNAHVILLFIMQVIAIYIEDKKYLKQL